MVANSYIKYKSSIAKIIVAAVVVLSGCKKDWLDAKPQLALVVPSTISDFQALLDNTTSSTGSSSVGGTQGFNVEQGLLSEVSAGDFYVTDDDFNSDDIIERNSYLWAEDLFSGSKTVNDWNTAYKKIYFSNIVLEGIEKIAPKSNPEQLAWNQVKGSALFFRAYNHFEMSQGFCKAYDKTNAANDLGIPLRLSSDLNTPSVRSSVLASYDAILKDLKESQDILPVTVPASILNKLRPTKNAANAMLARIYLSMAEYDSALLYSNKALLEYNQLLDYNTDINPFPYSIPKFGPEVIFYTRPLAAGMLGLFQLIVDSTLYKLYEPNDIRLTAFFFPLGENRFVGDYGEGEGFSGLATDEMYLIRSECYARRNQGTDKDAALADLNTLLLNRYITGTFTPVTAATAADALQRIIVERRKELCYRGIRWSDLRRLNKEPQFAVTLKRRVNGTDYTLAPNDPRYVFPIPPDVIALSGLEQNPR